MRIEHVALFKNGLGFFVATSALGSRMIVGAGGGGDTGRTVRYTLTVWGELVALPVKVLSPVPSSVRVPETELVPVTCRV